MGRVLILPFVRPPPLARAQNGPLLLSRDVFAQFERVARARAATVKRDVRHCHHGATAAPANPISPSPTHPQSFSFPHPLPSFLPSSLPVSSSTRTSPFLPSSFPPT